VKIKNLRFGFDSFERGQEDTKIPVLRKKVDF
jgi:hypothetical protein